MSTESPSMEPCPGSPVRDDEISTSTPDASTTTEEISNAPEHAGFRAPGLDCVALVKGRRNWSYLPGIRFEHNLHWATGLLELGNSGDFAANIWNDVPVPVYAIVFMAIGGTFAAIISVFSLRDGAKAWENVKFLKKQRQLLRLQRSQLLEESRSIQEVDVLLDVTKRELRNEIINRWAMDMFMGGGAILISIGTFLAIGGANRKVWMASNILSGYLGNAPIALFGILNFIWAIHMWKTKRAHREAAIQSLQNATALSVVTKYCFNVQLFFAVNGVSSIIGGVVSMLTATQWWAYVILIPVMISSYFCNFWWRRKIGYERPCLDFPTGLDTSGLVQALEFAEETRRLMEKYPDAAITQLVSDPSSLPMILDRFVEHGLFEDFSIRLIQNREMRLVLCGRSNTVEVDVPRLLALPDTLHPLILEIAAAFLRDQGPHHFQHRARFLAEILGTYLAMKRLETTQSEQEIGTEMQKIHSPKGQGPQ